MFRHNLDITWGVHIEAQCKLCVYDIGMNSDENLKKRKSNLLESSEEKELSGSTGA